MTGGEKDHQTTGADNASKKNKPSKNSRTVYFFCSTIVAFLGILCAGYIGYNVSSSTFEPKKYTLPHPPKLEGVLQPNRRLRNAQLLLKGQVWGPESILVEEDAIYTGTMDARLLKIVGGLVVKEIKFNDGVSCGKFLTEPVCGRPLGIRRLNKDLLVVADAYLGIFTVNFETGESRNVLSSNDEKLQGRNLSFVNDLDVLNEETIFFTDSTSKWDRRRFLHPFLEQRGDGRVFRFNVVSRELSIIIDAENGHPPALNFANGLQIHPDRKSFLVSECSMSRIIRYYFNGTRKGEWETFADNLPGFPDNIRLSKDGSKFYVAMAGFRHEGLPSLLDKLGGAPSVRKIIVDLVPESWLTRLFQIMKPKYGIFVVIDAISRKIVDAPQDEGGVIVDDISQVSDDEMFYYLGSFHADFIAKVPKKGF